MGGVGSQGPAFFVKKMNCYEGPPRLHRGLGDKTKLPPVKIILIKQNTMRTRLLSDMSQLPKKGFPSSFSFKISNLTLDQGVATINRSIHYCEPQQSGLGGQSYPGLFSRLIPGGLDHPKMNFLKNLKAEAMAGMQKLAEDHESGGFTRPGERTVPGKHKNAASPCTLSSKAPCPPPLDRSSPALRRSSPPAAAPLLC